MNRTGNGNLRNYSGNKVFHSEISSRHSGGAFVLMCDGSVHFLNDTIDPTLLKRLTTIDDGQNTELPDF